MTTETKLGRPTKLDDAMITALSSLVAKGNYYHDACAIVGISDVTFYEWIKLAQKDETDGLTEAESRYLRLSNAVKKARAQARADFVAVIHEAATIKREWLPAITYLERTDPANWGRKDRHQVDINETKVIQIIRETVVLAGKQGEIIEGEARELLEEGKE